MPDARPVSLLFVCWGNICRSPTAEAIMRHVADEAGLGERIHVDSAGTSGEHAGDPPDDRAQHEARRRGLDLSQLRARKITRRDLDDFDLVLVVDEVNERRLGSVVPPELRHKVRRLMDFGPDLHDWPDVPDPYYGGADGFTLVYDLVERACQGVLQHLVDEGLVAT